MASDSGAGRSTIEEPRIELWRTHRGTIRVRVWPRSRAVDVPLHAIPFGTAWYEFLDPLLLGEGPPSPPSQSC
jgi:hypothetical protein